MHVLIIDSSSADLRSMADLLAPYHISVSAAKSYAIAEKFLQSHKPDLLLLKKDPASAGFFKEFSTTKLADDIPILVLPEKKSLETVKKFLLQQEEDFALREAAALEEQSSEDSGTEQGGEESLPFPEIPGINWEEAVKNCGSVSIVCEVVQKFYDSIDERLESIESSFRKKDWKNYTIYVHALKSSARLIGALSLSSDARQLEAFGNCQSEDEIAEKTGPVLEQLRVFKDILKPVVKTPEEKKAEEGSKPLISEKDLEAALKDLKECLSITDFNSADFIIQELDNYQMPEDKCEVMAQIRQAVANVQKTKALELLGGL